MNDIFEAIGERLSNIVRHVAWEVVLAKSRSALPASSFDATLRHQWFLRFEGLHCFHPRVLHNTTTTRPSKQPYSYHL